MGLVEITALLVVENTRENMIREEEMNSRKEKDKTILYVKI